MEKPPEQEGVVKQFAFVDFNSGPTPFANVFIVFQQQDAFVLTVGQVTPVLIQGEGETVQQAPVVPIRVLSQFTMTETGVNDLIQNLQTSLETAQKARPKQGARKDDASTSKRH